MYGLDILYKEHKNILNFTNILEERLVKILEGDEVDTEFLKRGIYFIRNYADTHHHQKEEDILFKKMIEELGPLAEKLIRSGMLVEHDLARFTTGELEKAVIAFEENPSTKNKLDILAHGMNYVYLLRRHATKEDEVLYPFADKNLSEEMKEIINKETKEYEEIDKDFSQIEEFFI